MPETILSAGLAKRLAEAADGFRNGFYHYFIATEIFPYKLVCPAGDYSKDQALYNAQEELKKLIVQEPNYKIHGPYLTSPEDEIATEYDEIVVKLVMKTPPDLILPTFKNIDAIVFNLSAFDKFFLPYYTRLYGADKAKDIRINAKEKLMINKAVPHQKCTICPTVTD